MVSIDDGLYLEAQRSWRLGLQGEHWTVVPSHVDGEERNV